MAATFSTSAVLPAQRQWHSAVTRPLDDDSTNSEITQALPVARHERWFDLCFRLIILLLAAIWLMVPPAVGDARPMALKTAQDLKTTQDLSVTQDSKPAKEMR